MKKTCHGEFDEWSVFSAWRCDHCLWMALMPGSGWTEDRLAAELTSYEERGRTLTTRDEWYDPSPEQQMRVRSMALLMRDLLDGGL